MGSVPDVDPADFTAEAIAKLAPTCGECGAGSDLVRGSDVYPNRADLADLYLWRCSCGAYVGIHKGTLRPKGSPAGAATRAARMRAHAAFDPLWKRKAANESMNVHKARAKGYKWLAAQLGIEPKECHIGMMSAHDADRVVAVCLRRQR